MSRNNETGLFQALANPSRRAILHYLRDKDYVRAGDIAADLGIGHSTLSAHLKVLAQADLLMSRRQRTEIQYRANLSVLEEVIVSLAELRGSRSADEEAPKPEAAPPSASSSPTEREQR
ncbi:MAG: metalloregulator ArsR/SmtB family transcription factor [Propionibacteriaceae bacterium]